MKPVTYRIQKGCAYCTHCFVLVEYEGRPLYYCTQDDVPRPLCGSIYLGEGFGVSESGVHDSELFERELEEWDEWCKDREVHREGICDEYEEDDKE